MIVAPDLQTQLNNGLPTAKVDCAPTALSMGISAATGKQLIPSIPNIRAMMSNPNGATSLTQLINAANIASSKYATFTSVGPSFVPTSFAVTPIKGAWKRVRLNLAAGGIVLLFVGYGPISKSPYSGDNNFSGGHCIALFGYTEDASGIRWTVSYDDLFDGRHSYVPTKPTSVPLSLMREAAGDFPVKRNGVVGTLGIGRALAVAIS
jgi:hypothetical protein